MRAITSTGWSALRAVLACLPLLVATACGGDAWRSPGAPTPPSTSTPSPTDLWKDMGEYTMTMTAAPACSLPDFAMVRTYDAHVREKGRDVIVEFDDANFVGGWWGCGFTGTRDGDTMHFTLTSWDPGATEYAFIYQVNAATELGYIGTATGTMGDGRLVAAFRGGVVLYRSDIHKEATRCDAQDHRMELVRK